MKSIEYADENGVVQTVKNPPRAVWSRDISLEPGDRIYIHAEVEFENVLSAALQVFGPTYNSSVCERVDGPGTCTLEIDRIVE